ncbi:MAG: alcohol dehydrogenase catalytic domain-containing protein [Acidimicrobiales bacterium]
MKAVLFRAKDGRISVADVPAPSTRPGQVLVRNHFSLISAGTERARLQTGKDSLLGKARRRPDQVHQVMQSVRLTGPVETWRVVSDRLSSPMLTGYSSAGTVVEVGSGVGDIRPGELVACAGAGYANHCEYVVIPRTLSIWGTGAAKRRWKAPAKGHAEEMAGFVALLRGEETAESDFRLSLWTTLATSRLARAVVTGGPVEVEPAGGCLATVLGARP